MNRGSEDGEMGDGVEKKRRRRWNKEEHHSFLRLLSEHGRNWTLISSKMKKFNASQVQYHAYNYFRRVRREGLSDYIPPRGFKRARTPPPFI